MLCGDDLYNYVFILEIINHCNSRHFILFLFFFVLFCMNRNRWWCFKCKTTSARRVLNIYMQVSSAFARKLFVVCFWISHKPLFTILGNEWVLTEKSLNNIKTKIQSARRGLTLSTLRRTAAYIFGSVIPPHTTTASHQEDGWKVTLVLTTHMHTSYIDTHARTCVHALHAFNLSPSQCQYEQQHTTL